MNITDTPRLRIVAYHVKVEAVLDDGENLTPVPIDPVRVAAKDWPAWVAPDGGLAAALEVVQQGARALIEQQH